MNDPQLHHKIKETAVFGGARFKKIVYWNGNLIETISIK